MNVVSVTVPGPWWTDLSYLHEETLTCGVRVKVPLGASSRIGLISETRPQPVEKETLRQITEVLDSRPPLPAELRLTIEWFAKTWFTSIGTAAKLLLPSQFFKGAPLEKVDYLRGSGSSSIKYIYEPRDAERTEAYKEMLMNSEKPILAVFPEISAAKRFWNALTEDMRGSGLFWPGLSVSAQWDMWKRARAGEIRFAVGCQTASMIPLSGLSGIIIEEENSGAWKSQKYPEFHYRTLLAARAKFAGADLVLGGRMPSARVFMKQDKDASRKGIKDRLIFVDMKDSSSYEFAGIKDRLPISRPLLRETREALEKNKWAFWLLDRKGYAGEIFCDDCGSPLSCPKCSGVMRWEGKSSSLKCLDCGTTMPVPEKCMTCGGPFLEGQRPGLEALEEKARVFFRNREVLIFAEEGNKQHDAASLRRKYPGGALVLGTRKLISLADSIPPDIVGWIDADAEAMSDEYDGRAKAFTLMWESAWRGEKPDERKIVIQSRRPNKSWQRSLAVGWWSFWEREIKERREWGLPPSLPMLRIDIPAFKRNKLVRDLERAGFDHWESEDLSDRLWVRTRKFDSLRMVLEPYFDIKNTRTGTPKICIKLD